MELSTASIISAKPHGPPESSGGQGRRLPDAGRIGAARLDRPAPLHLDRVLPVIAMS
jgi:hypothetical protein